MNERTTITVTLVVKGDSDSALREVERRLGGTVIRWFIEDERTDDDAPFPVGALLFYKIDDINSDDFTGVVSQSKVTEADL